MLDYGCPRKEKRWHAKEAWLKKWEKEKKVVAMSEKNIICQGMIKERGNQHFKE